MTLLREDVSWCDDSWHFSSLLFPSGSRSLMPTVFSWPRRLDSASGKLSDDIFGKLDAGFSLFTCRILGTGYELSSSRKIGCSVATGSVFFSLGYA